MNTPIERLEIAKLVSFRIKEATDENHFPHMNNQWENVITRPRTEQKLAAYLRNISTKINVYAFLSSDFYVRVGDSGGSWYGINEWKDVLDDFGIVKDSSAINFIITSAVQNTLQARPPTAWMIVHMLCHLLYEEDSVWEYMWTRTIKMIYPNFNFVDVSETIWIMHKVLDFRAARRGEITRASEGIIELMVQAIVRGELLIRGFPKISFGRRIITPRKGSQEIWDDFSREFVQHTHDALDKVKGKYLFT